MKKIIISICLILLVFSLVSCKQAGKTDNVVVSIGESHKFSEIEIKNAVNCVKEKFKDFEGCNLTKLWYDEEKSNKFIEGYMSNGRGSDNGVKAENVIVLLSDLEFNPRKSINCQVESEYQKKTNFSVNWICFFHPIAA